jgi:Probable Zinc-ribbon domain
MKKLTLDEMRAIARVRGGECLSSRYEHSKTALRWRCAQGHEWEAAPASVKTGAWCKQCAVKALADRLRTNREFIEGLAKARGGWCLTRLYAGNCHQKLRWRCARGHEWEATLSNVRNRGSWCPRCAVLDRFHPTQNVHAMTARPRAGELVPLHTSA